MKYALIKNKTLVPVPAELLKEMVLVLNSAAYFSSDQSPADAAHYARLAARIRVWMRKAQPAERGTK